MSNISHTLTIYSDTKSLTEVDLFLKTVLKEFGLTENIYNRLYLCVSEAVVNAITHGNQSDKTKVVTILTKIEKEYAVVRISDEGQGFDSSILLDPTCTENIKKENGRGLFIIKNFSDEVNFKEKGNIIEFKLKLSGENTISR